MRVTQYQSRVWKSAKVCWTCCRPHFSFTLLLLGGRREKGEWRCAQEEGKDGGSIFKIWFYFLLCHYLTLICLAINKFLHQTSFAHDRGWSLPVFISNHEPFVLFCSICRTRTGVTEMLCGNMVSTRYVNPLTNCSWNEEPKGKQCNFNFTAAFTSKHMKRKQRTHFQLIQLYHPLKRLNQVLQHTTSLTSAHYAFYFQVLGRSHPVRMLEALHCQ